MLPLCSSSSSSGAPDERPDAVAFTDEDVEEEVDIDDEDDADDDDDAAADFDDVEDKWQAKETVAKGVS